MERFHKGWAVLLCLTAMFGFSLLPLELLGQGDFTISEDAHRANNRGVALLEQFKPGEAEAEFRRALALKPDLGSAIINLAVALFNDQKLDEARSTTAEFLKIEPESPRGYFMLGLIERSANRTDEALAAFQKVLLIDAEDVAANINVGQILTQKREYRQAIKYLESAYKTEPYNLTAIYNLATALQRSGERERAGKLLKEFQAVRDSNAGTSIGINYLEQGRYAEAITATGAEDELVLPPDPKISFQKKDVGLSQRRRERNSSNVDPKLELLRKYAGGAALFDFDGDGDLDLAKLNNDVSVAGKTQKVASGFSLYRNDRGRFTDVTSAAGDLSKISKNISTAVVAGDFDNDNKPDLFVLRGGSLQLFRNLGRGRFRDVSVSAKLPSYPYLAISAAFTDSDHDGDLDIFVAGFVELADASRPAPNLMLRNNRDGTFTDISATAKINQSKDKAGSKALAVVPTDFDNRRDVDLLVVNSGLGPDLLRNQRDGSFRDAAVEVGLGRDEDLTCVAAGDLNKDGFVDFFFGRQGRVGVFAVSDGKGKFVLKDAAIISATAAQFVDYDNDGLLDLIASSDGGFVILRNSGKSWSSVPSDALKVTESDRVSLAGSRQMLSGDADADGDIDLFVIARSGDIVYLQNSGGNANNSRRLSLQGRVSNRTGVGAKVLLRSGSLAQQLETYAASPSPAPSEVHFGLGRRERTDSIRVLWSSGIVQSETEIAEATAKNNAAAKIQEVDRKPSSCPYLYTWNGEKFEFITDFLGGGEMGSWAGYGAYHYPDSNEFVRIPPGKLRAKDGSYELRVTNELEEVMYLDHVKLVAVRHDENTDVYPNEGLGSSERSKVSFVSVRNAQPPVSATNSEGKSILAKIRDLDRIFYDDFSSQPIRGYAERHSIELKLDNRSGYNGRTILLLTGWTDYAFSSDNLAAAQSGRSLFMPYLQVKNARGEWQTVIDSIGIAVGRPQTLTVDLTGKFLSPSREVRIVTNFKTYWDKTAVDTSEAAGDLPTIEMAPSRANLRERGYSEEMNFRGMLVPNYEKVSFDNRWKQFSGRFTRLGDVRSLLAEIDDIFVISKTGDEFVLSFPELPAPPKGKTYTFMLFADGYSKEMDINSGSPDAVFPLPFKKMTTYPYGPAERHPMTEEQTKIYDETLTRYSRGGVADH